MPGYWLKNTHKVHSQLLVEEKRRRGAWSQKAWLLRLWVDSVLGGDEEQKDERGKRGDTGSDPEKDEEA